MAARTFPTLCLFFLWLSVGGSQTVSPTKKAGKVPTVTLRTRTSTVNKLHCQKTLTCRVSANKEVIQRILRITIEEKASKRPLEKVASIYHSKTENAKHDNGAKMAETLGKIRSENNSLIVDKVLPPHVGFQGEVFVCKVEYLDMPDTALVESNPLKGTQDDCNVPDQVDRYEAVERLLNETMVIQRKHANLLSTVIYLNSVADERYSSLSCDDILEEDVQSRHVISWSDGTKVLCDTSTAGGGWTIIQRRSDGSVSFNRSWKDYEDGFGDISGEFWLGLKNIERLLRTNHTLRVDLGQGDARKYALYSYFHIDTPCSDYKLSVGKYIGNAGDVMTKYSGKPFNITYSGTESNQGNCAKVRSGGWWSDPCTTASLNGGWGSKEQDIGVNWKGTWFSFTEMKVRPVDYDDETEY